MKKFDPEQLFLYAEVARIKLQEMSHLVQKSSPRLKYNLQVMEREGLVQHPHTIVDYSFLGVLLFRIYFKGGYISEKDKVAILQTLQQHFSVVAIYELGGEFDLGVEIAAPNPSRFNKELKKIIAAIPTLNNYKIVLNIVTHIYPRTYLLKKYPLSTIEHLSSIVNKHIIVGGDRPVEEFTTEEMKLLWQLVQHPRLRLSSLARQLQLNIKTVTSLYRQLQKKTVLKGAKHVINTTALGIFKQRLFLRLHNLSQERETELMEHFLKTPEIVQLNKTVGDWDLEVDVEALEKSRIRELIVQLREDFTDLIETFNSMEFYQYHKKTFLPKYLFQEEEKGN